MNKKIFKKLGVIATSVALITTFAFTAFADGRRVVTLGVDLSEDQKNAIVSYFGANLNTDEVVWVNNQEERALLSSWIPLEQIGSRTYSCAYVKPTQSGGIQVKTANLTWVTASMIASALATGGVGNCEVLAASPFPVSGTGALTGVMKAYEGATGQVIDESKKQLAAQELATTAEIANVIGQNEATELVNDIKIQIVNGKLLEDQTIDTQKIVDDAVAKAIAKYEEENAALKDKVALESDVSNDLRNKLVDVANEMVKQEYNLNQMSETLDALNKSIEENKQAQQAQQNPVNITNENNISINNNDTNNNTDTNNNQDTTNNNVENNNTNDTQNTQQEELPADSILLNTNADALNGAVETATNTEAVEVPAENTQTPAEQGTPFEIVTQDENSTQVEQPAPVPSPEVAPQVPTQEETSEIDITTQTVVENPVEPNVEAPSIETEAPVVETEAPVVETEAPAVETEAPAIETEAPATETTVVETEAIEIPTEPVTEPATEALEVVETPITTWNTEVPEIIKSVMEENMDKYDGLNYGQDIHYVPVPYSNAWAFINENGVMDKLYDMTQVDTSITFEEKQDYDGKIKNIEQVEGHNGLYKASLEDDSIIYYMLFITDEGYYAIIPSDENGTIAASEEELAANIDAFKALFEEAEIIVTETPTEEAPPSTEAPLPEDVENVEEYQEPTT